MSINTQGLFNSGVAAGASVRLAASVPGVPETQAVEAQAMPKEPELSAFARQLSAAAERAAARDSQLSRKDLADFASRVLDKIAGAGGAFPAEFYDTQLPDTDDPELLDRARQATDFIKGKGNNPFKGLSREQLSLITYDESGAFTVHERLAALYERNDQHYEWAKYISAKMDAERQQTGNNDQALYEIIDFYNSLPPIEVANYGNYEAILRMQIGQREVDWPEFNTSLIDMIANEWKPWAELDHSQSMADGDADEGEPS
ncbi:hypothetical protein J2W83_002328 [Pseudomonas hunanensis]|uniref:Uncharacterized protein n=1 Tax=Pseudomonas hunanensis TaxID=1247546 RepID=A0ACC6K2V6_9PSED|nr:hypothetical protein [Pseudomonas hunanensis]MDR6712727.1 hypothetical protein [Pseudomonas hunanensis]